MKLSYVYERKLTVGLMALCTYLTFTSFHQRPHQMTGFYTREQIEQLRREFKPAQVTEKVTAPHPVPVTVPVPTIEQLRTVEAVDCRKLFEDEESEQKKAKEYMAANPRTFPTDREITQRYANNCSSLLALGYADKPGSEEEKNFPIAFSMILHKDVHQAERLLRVVYQPQNYYCLHVDLKAEQAVHDAVKAIADCFPNVFVAAKQVKVVYASYLRLEAELNCMEEMLKRYSDWKYFINLVSSVLPLRTNREMVRILRIYNGANDIEGMKNVIKARINKIYSVKDNNLIKTDIEKGPPPHNIKLVKGSAYGIFSRAFIDFALNDQRAKDFWEWSKETFSPDELFWSTLNSVKFNPHLNAPGGYTGEPHEKAWLATYAAWGGPCASGKLRRSICIFGVGDLPNLHARHEFVANKFDLDIEYLAQDCLLELLQIRQKMEYPLADLYYYQHLRFIRR